MGQWDGMYFGDEHPPPPPKRPWLRDAILAVPISSLLGAAIGFRITRGFWPMAAMIGVTAFVFHTGIVGLSQLTKNFRLEWRHVRLVGAVCGITLIAALAVTWILTA